MTSTTDTTGHPDVAEISDLTEGLLPPFRSADVSRHLDECELCADVHASLEEIRGLLGALPAPPRMPDGIAQRIDAALAAETLPIAEAPESPDASVPVSRETSAGVARSTPGVERPAGRARSATAGPGRKDRKRGGRHRVAVLSVLTAAALGLGGAVVSSMLSGGGGGTSANGRPSTAADTFSEGTLEQDVVGLLSKSQDSRGPDVGIEGDPDTDPPSILKGPSVPVCVQKGMGREDAALATEKGVYQGTDSLLVVLPDTGDSTRVTAYIVDTACVENPSAQAKVLLKHSYTRP